MEWKKDTERKGVYSIKKKGKGWVKEMHTNLVCLANWELDFEFGCLSIKFYIIFELSFFVDINNRNQYYKFQK